MSSPRYLAAVCLFLTLSTSQCFSQIELEKTLLHNGIERSYLLYVPSSYAAGTEVPLVIAMHGFDTDATIARDQTEMNPVAEENGFLVAYPNAVNKNWFGGEDNVDFIANALLTDVMSDYAVDESRIYSTGWSQGGVMSYRVVSMHPDKFAAVASVSGTPGLPSWLPSLPEKFPMLYVHGTADPIAPFGGGSGLLGGQFPSVDSFIAELSTMNGCAESLMSSLPDLDTEDGTTMDVFSYSGCSSYVGTDGVSRNADVLFYRGNGMAHMWPGNETQPPASAVPTLWPGNFDFEASEAIWSFFEGHRVAAIPEPSGFVSSAFCVAAFFALRPRRHHTS